tara:strand:- start:256 stop:816 length:561 start_codon:yes stop_codon:yes gene_type:complete
MVYPLDKYVNVLIELGISPSQCLFCQLIYEQRHDLLYKYGTEGRIFTTAALADLEEKGYIIDTNPSDRSKYADFYEVTDKFISTFYTATPADGEEFWKSYPPFITIDGKKIPAKAVNKEELIKWYHRHIGAVHDHKKVMAALKYAKDKRLISMRIDKWLQSAAFEDLWQLMIERPADTELPHDTIL